MVLPIAQSEDDSSAAYRAALLVDIEDVFMLIVLLSLTSGYSLYRELWFYGGVGVLVQGKINCCVIATRFEKGKGVGDFVFFVVCGFLTFKVARCKKLHKCIFWC